MSQEQTSLPIQPTVAVPDRIDSEPLTRQPTEQSVFAVVPAFNEEEVIGDVLAKLLRSFSNVIVVDDGSSDNTISAMRGLDITLLHHCVNLGQGAALQTGLTYALNKGADIIITFDSDGQHRPEDAVRLVNALRSDEYDVILGSRFLGNTLNMPALRKLFLKAAIIFSNLSTRTKLTDAHNGLRAFNRYAAEQINISQNGMAHASELISQLGKANLRIKELPVTIEYTKHSLSKGQSTSNAFNILIDLLVGRFLQ